MTNNLLRYSNLNIRLDNSVKSLSRTVAYHLSGTIENGMMFTDNTNIVIYSDRIDFGKCNSEYRRQNEEIKRNYEDFFGIPGNLAPYFFFENGCVIYRFGHFFKYDPWSKKLDYDSGGFDLEAPDNEEIFRLLYPRFA